MFKSIPSGVSTQSVVKLAVEMSNVFLCVGGGEMNGNINAAMDRIGLLPDMYGFGGEPMLSEGEVFAFTELLVFDFFLCLFVEHPKYLTCVDIKSPQINSSFISIRNTQKKNH